MAVQPIDLRQTAVGLVFLAAIGVVHISWWQPSCRARPKSVVSFWGGLSRPHRDQRYHCRHISSRSIQHQNRERRSRSSDPLNSQGRPSRVERFSSWCESSTVAFAKAIRSTLARGRSPRTKGNAKAREKQRIPNKTYCPPMKHAGRRQLGGSKYLTCQAGAHSAGAIQSTSKPPCGLKSSRTAASSPRKPI